MFILFPVMLSCTIFLLPPPKSDTWPCFTLREQYSVVSMNPITAVSPAYRQPQSVDLLLPPALWQVDLRSSCCREAMHRLVVDQRDLMTTAPKGSTYNQTIQKASWLSSIRILLLCFLGFLVHIVYGIFIGRIVFVEVG